MTRFARGKGSKASNERVPEKATSWTEMKQQLLEKNKEVEESKNRQQANDLRNANYKAFLKEKEENESKLSTWADFPNSTKETVKKVKDKWNISPKKTEHLKNFINENSSDFEDFMELKTKVDQALNNLNKIETQSVMEFTKGDKKNEKVEDVQSNKNKLKLTKRNKPKQNGNKNVDPGVVKSDGTVDSDSDAPPEEETAKKEITKPLIKIKKPKHKKLKNTVGDDKKSQVNGSEVRIGNPKRKRNSSVEEGTTKKLKKDNTDKDKTGNDKGSEIKTIKENLTEKDLRKIEKKKQKRLKQVLKKKRMKEELKNIKMKLMVLNVKKINLQIKVNYLKMQKSVRKNKVRLLNPMKMK